MANAPISRPRVFQSGESSWPKTRPSVGDGSNTFVSQQFVRVASGVLIAYAADDTSIYGLTPDGSHAATDEGYSAPYGEKHNVIDPRGTLFLMNVTDASGTEGSGTTTAGDVTIGTRYSAVYGATSTSVLMIDAADSGTATKNIFQVVAKYDAATYGAGDVSTDFNGRVVVKVIDTAIQ